LRLICLDNLATYHTILILLYQCEDARAALNLYKLKQDEWEELILSHRKKSSVGVNDTVNVTGGDETNQDGQCVTSTLVDKPKRVKRNMFGLDDMPDTLGHVVSMSQADRILKDAKRKG